MPIWLWRLCGPFLSHARAFIANVPGNSFGKKRLPGIARHVFKGQSGNRRPVGQVAAGGRGDRHGLAHHAGHRDADRPGHCLQPRRHVDAVAMDVISLRARSMPQGQPGYAFS